MAHNRTSHAINPVEFISVRMRPYFPFTVLNTVWRRLDKSSKTVLDVGCGKGEPMAFINRHGRFKVVGIDIFRPYLESLEREGIYEDLILADVRCLPLKDKSFDAVVCMEVLEHLGRADGEKLFQELERVARNQILITTPLKKYGQDPYDGNPYQKHRYIWQLEELRERGYKVKGAGIRGLPREETNSAFLRILRTCLYIAGGVLSYGIPSMACHAVGEKTFMESPRK